MESRIPRTKDPWERVSILSLLRSQNWEALRNPWNRENPQLARTYSAEEKQAIPL
jgi:hypothetical protein